MESGSNYQSINETLLRFTDYKGRSTRREFWIYFLFYYLITFIAGWMDIAVHTTYIGQIFTFVLFVPYLACAVRRMHDVGKRGWFVLIPLYNLYLFTRPSKPTE